MSVELRQREPNAGLTLAYPCSLDPNRYQIAQPALTIFPRCLPAIASSGRRISHAANASLKTVSMFVIVSRRDPSLSGAPDDPLSHQAATRRVHGVRTCFGRVSLHALWYSNTH